MVSDFGIGRLVQEPAAQVLRELFLDLGVAIEMGGDTIALHLDVGVIAEAKDNAQAFGVGLVQERLVVRPRVVAIQSHDIGTHRPDHCQVASPMASPEHRCVFRHEVIIVQPLRMLRRHRGITDALNDLLRGMLSLLFFLLLPLVLAGIAVMTVLLAIFLGAVLLFLRTFFSLLGTALLLGASTLRIGAALLVGLAIVMILLP
mmetsp:Transcript_113230/g.283526  ORF Transcript_113230/g.283526 Transcript_113230/m.283526 type:complete len:203 (-) Transcript_113230:1288-1896(-)